MIQRLDLFGRLLLILLGSLTLLGAAGALLIHLREVDRTPVHKTKFPRLEQVAGIVDLIVDEPSNRRSAVVRAANGVDLEARLATSIPGAGDLAPAPRLQARLAHMVRSGTAVTAYVSPRFKPRHSPQQVEGFLARAVALLPDGRYLVIDAIAGPDDDAPYLFGWPLAIWMGGAATLVVLLALWGTARETRPLRDLSRAMHRFDGTTVTMSATPSGVAPDVRRTAEAVSAMQERVMTLLGERSLLIGAISHDLRTFLTRMRLRVTALSDDRIRVPLENDVEGMDTLLSDALAFARGTSTGSERIRLDLADLAASELAERQARGQSIDIELMLEDALCLGDTLALRRVLANLVDNALKYGAGRVCISTGKTRDEAWLRVEDNGPGISEDQRAAMLLPYRRGKGEHVSDLAGSGLGLAIVQQIVTAHGGRVTISDATLGGACVSVTIANL